mmetsp:Transcript_13422/g.45234  ORF Transcript_13422/g.45234 Transcript_13422/m.45234 type:complete len:203 (-) Transcript_13422:241-849(-)
MPRQLLSSDVETRGTSLALAPPPRVSGAKFTVPSLPASLPYLQGGHPRAAAARREDGRRGVGPRHPDGRDGVRDGLLLPPGHLPGARHRRVATSLRPPRRPRPGHARADRRHARPAWPPRRHGRAVGHCRCVGRRPHAVRARRAARRVRAASQRGGSRAACGRRSGAAPKVALRVYLGLSRQLRRLHEAVQRPRCASRRSLA